MGNVNCFVICPHYAHKAVTLMSYECILNLYTVLFCSKPPTCAICFIVAASCSAPNQYHGFHFRVLSQRSLPWRKFSTTLFPAAMSARMYIGEYSGFDRILPEFPMFSRPSGSSCSLQYLMYPSARRSPKSIVTYSLHLEASRSLCSLVEYAALFRIQNFVCIAELLSIIHDRSMKIHTNLSVSAWNVIKFIIIEFTMSVLFSRAWVSFQESYASRKVTQGRVVEVRTSRVGRLTPAETIAIPCVADDNLVTHSRCNIGNGTKGRILLVLVNGVLLATVLTMEFGSGSEVSRENILSKFVTSKEMRKGARLGNSSNSFQVGVSFDTSFLQLEEKGGKYMRINMPSMGHSKSEGWMNIEDGRANIFDIFCGGSYQSLFNIPVCNHDLLIDEPNFWPLTGEHFDGLILRRKKSDKIEKYLKTYEENEPGQHSLIEGLIAEYYLNKSRKSGEKNGKRPTVTCHGVSENVILEEGEGEEFFPDFCIMNASDILLFRCENPSPGKESAATRHKRLQRLGSKSFHCQYDSKKITRIRTKMGMGIYAAAASLGLKTNLYKRFIGSYEMVRKEVGMLELSAITASFGWSPEFSSSGIVATGERKEHATLSIQFIAGLVLLIVYSLILFVTGLILSKKSTLSVPIDIHACLKSLLFYDLQNWETENCTNQWPRFGVSNRGGKDYLSAYTLQNELQRSEKELQATDGCPEVKLEVE